MRKLLGCFGTIVLVLIVAAGLVALMGGEDDAGTTCTPAPDAILADIGEGLNDGVALADAYMARAKDRENVTFIAAQVDEGEVAVWATSRIDDEGNSTDTGLIYSVGDVALSVSNWGDGGRTDAALSLDEAAARQAQDCAATD